MLTIRNLTYRIGVRTLLENASTQLPEGRRVGLVGRNGTGKTTLLDLIMGEIQGETGTIETPRRWKIGRVAQEAPGGDTTPLEFVLAADTERAELLAKAEDPEQDPAHLADIHMRLIDIDAYTAPSRAATILAGLGFDVAAQDRPLSSFSGGWRMRVSLAAVLFSQPDLLLLDEPTNHLDLEAALWLESYLQTWSKTMLIVSHDRHILNAVVTHILHLDECALTLYTGDYDNFERVREERRMQAISESKRVESQRKHLQDFVDRFKAKASKARQAQSKMKMLARLATVAVPPEDPETVFNFPDPAELRPPLITIDRVDVGYEAGKPILRNVNMRLDPSDRIALLGANGNGKSTLAKLLAGRLTAQKGDVRRPSKMTVGFFAQHQIEDMDEAATPFIAMGRVMTTAKPEQIRARLGRFGFGQQKAEVKIGHLSGGERARLNFALITHDAPSLLILDEPTNHLDIQAREALVEAINDYGGAVVLVSHDRYLVELTADTLWQVADGQVTPFDGDIDDYRRLTLSARAKVAEDSDAPKSRKNERRAGAADREALEPLRRKARDTEQLVEKLTAERAKLDADLATPRVLEDSRKLADLTRRRGEVDSRLVKAEEDWLEAQQALDAQTAS